MEKGESTADDYLTISFEDILRKEFTLYYNDSVYSQSTSMVYPFTYNGEKKSLDATENEGMKIKVSGILRLKDGLTYGCLSGGLNLTEQTVESYIAKNMQSKIVTWMNDPKNAITTEKDGQKITIYRSPSEYLNGYYYRYIDEGTGLEGYLTTDQSRAAAALWAATIRLTPFLSIPRTLPRRIRYSLISTPGTIRTTRANG